MKTVKFATTGIEADLIGQITARAWETDLRYSYKCKLDLRMDVTATHCNGNPLRLSDLLAADDFNFFHDMSGICNCLDRDTGQLKKNFRPRFSQPRAA